MMTTQPSTKTYKVFFERTHDNVQYVLVVEATSAFEAGVGVLESLGSGYDLIKVIGVKKQDLN